MQIFNPYEVTADIGHCYDVRASNSLSVMLLLSGPISESPIPSESMDDELNKCQGPQLRRDLFQVGNPYL